MFVQTSGSYPFSNPYVPTSYEKENVDTATQFEKLKQDYNMIFQELKPAERKLYDSLIYSENYLAARGIVTVGFMRAAGLYEDQEGKPLSGESLAQDLSRLNPPASSKERSALNALQNHVMQNPIEAGMDQTIRGNLLDLKI